MRSRCHLIQLNPARHCIVLLSSQSCRAGSLPAVRARAIPVFVSRCTACWGLPQSFFPDTAAWQLRVEAQWPPVAACWRRAHCRWGGCGCGALQRAQQSYQMRLPCIAKTGWRGLATFMSLRDAFAAFCSDHCSETCARRDKVLLLLTRGQWRCTPRHRLPEDLQCLSLAYGGTRFFLCVPVPHASTSANGSNGGSAKSAAGCLTIGFCTDAQTAGIRCERKGTAVDAAMGLCTPAAVTPD